MPLFSVLIAIHNAEQWLDACLDSLAAQTCPDFEALCVDDCSTDASAAIVGRRAAADPRFIPLLMPVNSGQAAARNLGLARATGRYTLFLDADDSIAPDALALLARDFAAAPDVDAAVFRLVMTWPDGRIAVTDDARLPRVMSGREACLLSIDWRLHGVYALRTDIHRRLPYSTALRRYADDNTTCLHYLACRRVVRSQATYFYRQHQASCTHAPLSDRLLLLKANALRRTMLEQARVGRRGLRICERYCWYNLVGLYREFLLSSPEMSPAERLSARHQFSDALHAMRPLRLSPAILRHPSTVFLRPFALFRFWQRFLLSLHRR